MLALNLLFNTNSMIIVEHSWEDFDIYHEDKNEKAYRLKRKTPQLSIYMENDCTPFVLLVLEASFKALNNIS